MVQQSFKAIVFDWDLTLWNSWDIHLWLMRRTADALGRTPPQPDEVAKEYSRPFLQHLSWFFGDDQDAILDTYMGFYNDNVAHMAGLYPGAADTLRALKDQGYRLAVFSDKRQPFGLSELEQTGVGHLLDHASFLVDGRPYKPEPRGLLEVMNFLGVSPGETLYVGDSRQDMECAHRAGAHSGAALWGCVDRERVLAQRPGYQWEQVEQILDSLGAGPA